MLTPTPPAEADPSRSENLLINTNENLRLALAHLALAEADIAVFGLPDSPYTSAMITKARELLNQMSGLDQVPLAVVRERPEAEVVPPVRFVGPEAESETEAGHLTPPPPPAEAQESVLDGQREDVEEQPIVEDQQSQQPIVADPDHEQPADTSAEQPVVSQPEAVQEARTPLQIFLDDSFATLSRDEKLSFCDARNQIDVGLVVSQFGFDALLQEGKLGEKLIDVYANYRGGEFDALLPPIEIVDDKTIQWMDGTLKRLALATQREVVNLIYALSPFGFINNRQVTGLLGITSGSYFSRLKKLRDDFIPTPYFDLLIPSERSIAARLLPKGELEPDQFTPSSEASVQESSEQTEPEPTEHEQVPPPQPTSEVETADSVESTEPSVAEQAQINEVSYVDEDGVWDIFALKIHLGHPTASHSQLQRYLTAAIIEPKYLPSVTADDCFELRLELNQASVAINGQTTKLIPIERAFVNLLALNPEHRLNVDQLVDSGIYELTTDQARKTARDLAEKFNTLSSDLIIQFDVKDGKNYQIFTSKPLAIKEPIMGRRVKSLSQTAAI